MFEPDADARSPDLVEGRAPDQAQGVDSAALIDEQRARWRRGERRTVEEYLERHPGLEGRDATILDLIYNEVVLRAEAGEAPRLEEYQARFPRWAPQLELQFAGPGLSTAGPSAAGEQTEEDPAAREEQPFESTIEFTEVEDGFHPNRPAGAGGPRRTGPLPKIPGYEVLRELGRGGMGVVYLARQVRLNRLCALKTILAGDHAAPEAAVRFLTEAETVARLQHPNIVQIHAVGDHDGLPYIELEFIEGGSLNDRLDGTPWPPERAARLIATVARTIHEAHALGVVHRDLKPANVLLGADETPKLTDFGLAKSLHIDSGLTRTETIMGSPSYMAPEQADGGARSVGPAADIYALGAILYELLTGRAPFRAATLLETLEQVKSTDAVPPSRLQPGLPRALETIVLKCVEKDPQRRYLTARELAEDLDRFLAGEPIRAQPVGVLERAVKWVRRRPLEAALSAVTVLALLSLTWAFTASRYERNLARKNRELDAALADVKQQRTRAKRSFDQARDVVDYFITLIEQRLDEPELKPARDELLAEGLAYYQGFLQHWDDTPELQFELIRTYTGAARVADSIGSRTEALKAYRQALAMLEMLVTRCPDVPQYRLELADVHHRLGGFYLAGGQIDQSLREYEAGRAIREQLRRERPADPRVLTDLARSHGFIGDLLLAAGRLDEAESAYRESHQIREGLARAVPHDVVLQFELSRSFSNLSRLKRQVGRLDEALDAYRRAIALAEPLSTESTALREFRGDLPWACAQLANMLLEADPPAAAEALEKSRRAREIYARLTRAHPGVPGYRGGLALSLLEIGLAQRVLGHRVEALRGVTEARTQFGRLVTENNGVTQYQSGLARSWDAAGMLQLDAGAFADARQSCQRARDLFEQLLKGDPGNREYRSNLGQALANLARAERGLARPAEAAETLEQAIAADRAALAAIHSDAQNTAASSGVAGSPMP